MKLNKVLEVRGRRGLRTVVAQIILLSLVLGMFSTPALAALPHVFNDGFESGDLSNWTTVNQLVVQQDEVYMGDYAARAISTTGTPAYAYKQLSATYTELYYRLWFKIISQGETNQVILQRFRTSTNSAIMGVYAGQNGTLNFRNDVTNTNVTSTTPVSKGVWHQLQVRIVINGASGQSEVWLDNARVDALSLTQDFGTTPVGVIQLGESSNFRNFDVALDRVAVDTEFIDPADPPETTVDMQDIDVEIAGSLVDSPKIAVGQAATFSYADTSNGPVEIRSTDTTQIVGSEGILYRVQGTDVSFSELMGLPNGQLDNVYWLPWYNNRGLDTQLRFANMDNAEVAEVEVFIGGEKRGDTIFLQPGASDRVSFFDVSDGPVEIRSNVNIVAAERIIYKVAGNFISYSEIMALPERELDNVYWFPWYNNYGLDTQLRFANADDSVAAEIEVFVGGDKRGETIILQPGESDRVSFTALNDGPVEVRSNVNIVAAMRVIYKVGGAFTGYSELMGLPDKQLSDTYWLPWYNNTGNMDTQLRFGNVSNSEATVHVYIAGQEMVDSPFVLQPGESTRPFWEGFNTGPVEIKSNVPIVAAERVIYKAGGVPTSFTEMMGLPQAELDTVYWFPWYNTRGLISDLRIGVPGLVE
ncbi:MAG TPA: hypothetical protein VFG81_16890 [Anaerolineales bacterium]|jgi:hypothetical protein|nr:hypothetical protein [Anaerolineales bacterium]